jgi:multiple sugar transport system permease protein
MIPGMFGAAACVFFMRQFFAGIPDSLIEAAKLDGLGFIGIFFQIMVPLSVPALLAQGLLGFIGGYNDYFGPLIYLQSNELYSLQIALSVFANVYGDEQNVVMAGTIIALIPTLIIYFIAQDFFIEGIATSGIKG